jgi:hypothetical protein
MDMAYFRVCMRTVSRAKLWRAGSVVIKGASHNRYTKYAKRLQRYQFMICAIVGKTMVKKHVLCWVYLFCRNILVIS